ncbi:hypothetical protein IFM89_029513 [Coptis chinensis]|uniref:H(+)-exporting diphosphatase n=1 Tax=Coptis chinensis TaxID=261450 RepID=A0A835HXC3_9MAGN|nr:hypothetical protein IFM89_029513 [Coptis chinensis]
MTREGKSSNVVTYNSIVDAIGLWVTTVIGFVIEYSTSNAYSPVLDVANSCRTGAATNVILGLAVGYKSVIIQIFAIADVIGKSHLIRERTDTLDAIGITTDLLLWFLWHSLVLFCVIVLNRYFYSIAVPQEASQVDLKVPVVVRLEGTNVDQGKRILKESGMALITAEDLDDAAEKAVKAAAS